MKRLLFFPILILCATALLGADKLWQDMTTATTLGRSDELMKVTVSGANETPARIAASNLGSSIRSLDGFSILFVPDTQEMPTNIMAAMRDEVIARIGAGLNLQAIVTGGDITQTNDATEYAAIRAHFYDPVYAAASNALRVVTTGNHDVPSYMSVSRDTSLFNTYFGNSVITNNQPSDVAYLFQTNGYSENMAAIRTIAGEKWAFIGLEAFPRQAALNWASNVVVSQSITPGRVVLVTHSHLRPNGALSGGAAADGFADAPRGNYAAAADGLTGKDVWAQFGRRFAPLILSCHELGSGFGRRSQVADSGRVSTSVLVNGQIGTTTGDGSGTGLLDFMSVSGGVVLSDLWHPTLTLDIPEAESPIDLDVAAPINPQAVGTLSVRTGTGATSSALALQDWTSGVLTDGWFIERTNGALIFRWGRTNGGSTASSNLELLRLGTNGTITQNAARILPANTNAWGATAWFDFDGPSWDRDGVSLLAPTNTPSVTRVIGASHTGIRPLGIGLAYSLAPALTNTWSATMWYRRGPTNSAAANIATLVGQHTSGANGSWFVGILTTNTVRVGIVTNGVRANIDYATNLNNSVWHHIAVTYDSASALKIYMDGLPVKTNTVGTALSNGGVYSFGIGGNPTFSGDNPDGGDIDGVALFPRVLTDTEVLDLGTHR